MARTEPWWVCRCGAAVAQVGKNLNAAHQKHALTCKMPGYGIQQLAQRKQGRRTK